MELRINKIFLRLIEGKKMYLKSDKMRLFKYFCHCFNKFYQINLTLRHESRGNKQD